MRAPPAKRVPSVVRGLAWMSVAGFTSAGMNAIIRHLSPEVHAFEIAFFRNVFGLVVLAPAIIRAGLESLRTTKLVLHGMRGILNAFAMLCFFYGVGITPLSTVAALSFTAPLFATVLAALILREPVGPRRVLALLAGFSGAMIILRPGLQEVHFGEVLIVVSSLAWAGALVDIKILSRTDTALQITFFASAILTPITLIAALPHWTWVSWTTLAWLFLVGALGSLGQVSVARAFQEGDASQVLPADFTKLIWATVLGVIVFSELPDPLTLLGGTIIFASVVYVAYRESVQRRALLAQAKAAPVSSLAAGTPAARPHSAASDRNRP